MIMPVTDDQIKAPVKLRSSGKTMDRTGVAFIVLDIYPCYIGGLEIFYNKLLPEVSKKFDVTLITCCSKVKAGNYTVHKIPRRFLSIPGTTRITTLLFTALALIRLRRSISIVHLPYTGNSGKWGFVLPFLKKYFGISYLLHIHGGGMMKWKRMSADKALFKHAGKILAVSKVTKEEYERRSGKEVELVFPLVPFTKEEKGEEVIRRELNLQPDEKVILFVGSIKPLKAPDVLLRAFFQLGREFIQKEKLKLIFVGGGSMLSSLEKEVTDSGFGDHVRFVGKIPYAEVPGFYKIADIYVIPSRFEGTPKSLLEAMYNELPIIGADVNGIQNILEHGVDGLLFQKDDAEDLKQCLKKFIKDESEGRRQGKAAKDKYEKSYTFEQTIDNLTRIYKDQ